jgi:hypothetical protein
VAAVGRSGTRIGGQPCVLASQRRVVVIDETPPTIPVTRGQRIRSSCVSDTEYEDRYLYGCSGARADAIC